MRRLLGIRHRGGRSIAAESERPGRFPAGRPRLAPGTKFVEHTRALQVFLDNDLRADGVYGRATARAVRRLQAQLGVVESGVVDTETWAAIEALDGAQP